MTHPDFQSIVQWVSAPLASGTNTAYGVGTTALVPATTLLSYQNVMVRVTNMSSDALFTIFSYDSTTGLLATGQRRVWLRSGQPATFIVPILGGAFALNIQGAGAGSTITWAAYGTNLPTGLWPNDPTNSLVYRNPELGVAPGAGLSYQMPPYSGWATFSVITSASPGSFSIYGTDFGGVVSGVYLEAILPATSRQTYTFYIGPTNNQFVLLNSGAVAGDYYLFVQAAPSSRELY